MGTSGKKPIIPLFILLTIILLMTLAWRLGQLTLSRETRDSPVNGYTAPLIASRVVRGSIYDRNGTILALEIPYYTCAVMLKSVESLEKTAETLSPILFMTKSDILRKMEGKTTYAMIKQRMSRDEMESLQAEISEGLLPGVIIEKRYGRFYPQGHHASQLIGFTGIDNIGLEGLEYYFNDTLSPLPQPDEEITTGNDIYLTIDMRIQFFTDRQVELIAEEHDPDSISALVMNSDTGEILAWASYPWYDINRYSSTVPEERINRPAVSMYEPGSVFKIYSLAAILDLGEAQTDEYFICDGSYSFTMPNGKQSVISCVAPHGTVGPREILKYSCNGAIAHYALQTDAENFYRKLLDFGFTSSFNLPVPGETAGYLAAPENWSGRTLPTIAFGQEIGVSALQMAAAATPFDNGGVLLQPSVISRIASPEGKILESFRKNEIRQVIGADTAEAVLEMMTAATEPGGTAVHAQAEDVATAAKTGTAQILDPGTRTYSASHVLASCIALLPASDPEFIIYITVDNPKSGQLYGSTVAAPAVGQIAEDLVSAGLAASSRTNFLVIPGERLDAELEVP
ncbi:MAG: penicillin-binding protein 2 [Spirochaetia bacterium]|nr:penicillin-binding protein 2 [Spirochaetia bacterium]